MALPNGSLTIEIHLEGQTKPDDDICLLRTENGRRDPDLQKRIQKALGIGASDCNAFMMRLRLKPGLPSRDSIIARNLRALGNHASQSVPAAIEEMYERVVARIYAAMALDLLDKDWFELVTEPKTPTGAAIETFEAKRLTREALRSILSAAVTPARPLLRRIVETESSSPSVLEQKLLLGGAPAAIVETAKSLRANAAIQEFENEATTLWGEDSVLDDVRERLRLRVEGLVAVHEQVPRPAVNVWSALIEQLPGWAGLVDQHGIFRKDPDLLLGEICQMADLCQTDWGRSNAP